MGKAVSKVFFLLLCFVAIAVSADAVTYRATVTADNHYALYFGNATGITAVGRNEMGYSGSSGGYNWSWPETFNFNVAEGDFIYVAAWSDNGSAQGWIGQFVSDRNTTFSNTRDWQAYLTKNDLGDGDTAPSAATVKQYAGMEQGWFKPTHYKDHGAQPWGGITGIDSEADWIWGSPMEPGSGFGEFQIFRTQVVGVPEPPAVYLLGIVLMCLALVGAKKRWLQPRRPVR